MKNYYDMSEKDLGDRMRACDAEVLYWLLNGKYKAGLRYLIYCYYGAYDEADDFIPDLIELLIKDDCRVLKTFRNESSFRTWLFTVARNFICKRLRKRRTYSDLKHDIPDAGYNIDAVLDVAIILTRLSEKHRRVLEGLYIEGLSPEELAERMGCRVDNIYNLKHRALASARLIMESLAYGHNQTDEKTENERKNNKQKTRKK